MDKVVFIDRDGTINVEVGYLHKKEDLKLFPDVAKGIALLKQRGYQVVVITNQAGVARGYYTEEDVEILHNYLNEQLLVQANTQIDDFYYCPHHPVHGIGKYKQDCDCRKPNIGMFKQREQVSLIHKQSSWMIGDKQLDVEAGKRFGLNTILVSTGYGKTEHEKEITYEDYYAETFFEAVKIIIESKE